MEKGWHNTLAGINTYVAELPDKEDTYLELRSFDSVIYTGVAVHWRGINSEYYRPRGMTPLYDHIKKSNEAMTKADEKFTTFLVVSDGEENASHYTSQADVKRIMQRCEEKKWPVVFVGASFEKIIEEGAKAGLHKYNTVAYNSMEAVNTQDMFRSLSKGTTAYNITGNASVLTYSDTQRTAFGAAR